MEASTGDFIPVEIVVPGLTSPIATAINNNNAIVGYGTGSNGTVGFLDVNGSFSFLSCPGATSTQPFGINDAGNIVGMYMVSGAQHGFEYSGGAYTTIDAPSPASPNSSALRAINNQGQILGVAVMSGGGVDSFVDTGGAFQFLPMSPGQQVIMYGQNDSGELVGFDVSANGSSSYPIYGTVNGFTEVQGQPVGTQLTAVNNQGYAIATSHGVSYLYSNAAETNEDFITAIYAPGSFTTQYPTTAMGLNNSNAVVGSYVSNSDSKIHAFIATPGAGPSCLITGNSGPPRQITFTLQDSSGLSSITINSEATSNANITIPSFTAGTTSPVYVTATASNPAQLAEATIVAADTQNAATSCNSFIFPGSPAWMSTGGRLIGNMTLVTYPDGRLAAFGLGTDAALWYSIEPSGEFDAVVPGTKIVSPPVPLSGDPAAFVNRNGLLEALVTDGNGQLWTIAQQTAGDNFSKSTWQSIASRVQGKAAVTLDASGIPNAFVQSSDGSVLWLKETSPFVWSVVGSLGGVTISNPMALLDGSGNIQIYALGTDNALWNTEITQQGSVVPWFSLGGSLAGDPGLISSAGTLYVFSRGADEALWFNTQGSGGSWTGWQSLGGVLTNNPRAAVNSDGRVEVFVAGSDSSVWHTAQVSAGSAQWSVWSYLGGVIVGDVTPYITAYAILDLVVRAGSDGSLWWMEQPVADSWQ